ncbi:MAG: hypothetical protein LBG80_06790 [Bacteroidales bacterium]|nr:hypothetical protein [Bacteroidales bacterium]
MQSIFGPHNPSNPLSKYIQFDPKLKIGMRGSTQTGVRNNPNKTGNWNPKDFDLDLFIVSDELAAMNNGKIVKLPQVRDSLADDFPELFSGLRQGDKGVSVKFYTQVQAQNKGGTIFYDGSK